MKCIMLHFILVFTVCKITHLGVCPDTKGKIKCYKWIALYILYRNQTDEITLYLPENMAGQGFEPLSTAQNPYKSGYQLC